MVFLYMHKGRKIAGIETPERYIERMIKKYKKARTPREREGVDILVITAKFVGKISDELRGKYEEEKQK